MSRFQAVCLQLSVLALSAAFIFQSRTIALQHENLETLRAIVESQGTRLLKLQHSAFMASLRPGDIALEHWTGSPSAIDWLSHQFPECALLEMNSESFENPLRVVLHVTEECR